MEPLDLFDLLSVNGYEALHCKQCDRVWRLRKHLTVSALVKECERHILEMHSSKEDWS